MFLIIGHRGACGYEPENTLLSFRRALELNVDMIETDVYRCKTGELVLIHDKTVDRTTNGMGYIENLTFQELRTFNAGKEEKIPSLEETLELLAGKTKINLELKGENTAKPVYEILNNFVKNNKCSYDDFYISSFNHRLLKEFVSLVPDNLQIKICPLIDGIPLDLTQFKSVLRAYSLNISSEFINSEIIKEAHALGMKVFVYTINKKQEALKIKSLGIDGIFTDYPDMVRDHE